MAHKQIRFAALIRGSTEKQAKQGESLRTQKANVEECVEQLNGRIVEQYGGQEHATVGWERHEFDRLLRDAARGKFDALIVNHIDRWGRDDKKSIEGRDIFKANGIRFFVRTTEFDLFGEDDQFRVGIDVLIAQRNARIQNRKSLMNKIHRAQRGIPCTGSLPFGRTFDKKTEKWGVVEDQRAMMVEIADRYLSGDSLNELAQEYGIKPTTLYERLNHCGPKWTVYFKSDELKIEEAVTIDVPPLLDQTTIRAMRKRVEANTTFAHGHLKYRYLLGRMVFCGHCGSAFSGQYNNGVRYYRHLPSTQKTCEFTGAVRADDLEESVISRLFECFGNPPAVAKAIEDATPNRERIQENRKRLERLIVDLAKLERGVDQILDMIADGRITETRATRKLDEFSTRRDTLQGQIEQLNESFANVPSKEAIELVVDRTSAAFGEPLYASPKLAARKRIANRRFDKMTWEEKRTLIETVFGGMTTDGTRMGVRVVRVGGEQKWKYEIQGHLIDAAGYAPQSRSRLKSMQAGSSQPSRQSELLTRLSLERRLGPSGPIRRRRCCRPCRSRRRGGG